MDDKVQRGDDDDFTLSIAPIEGERVPAGRAVPGAADPFAPRRTRRAHLLRTAAAWGAVALVTVSILFGSLRSFLLAPTPLVIATIAPTANPDVGRVYFMGWAPWGQLRIDQAAAITLSSQLVYPTLDGFFWPSFDLTPGRHTLRYTAEDFPSLTCVLSVPEARGDTCPVAHPSNGATATTQQVRRALILPAAPENLPFTVATDLDGAVQRALDAFALADTPRAYGIVAAGEPIQVAQGQSEGAPTALRANPHYQLNRDPASATSAVALAPTSACVTLCTADPQLSLYPDEAAWPVTANVAISWEYRGTDGAQSAVGTTPTVAHVRVDLAVRRDGAGWQAQVLQQPLCQASLQAAEALDLAPNRPPTQIAWAALSSVPAVDGCLLLGYLPDARGGSEAPTALIVARFGVLLAANPLAGQLYPQLLAASAAQAAHAQAVAGG